MEQPVRPGLRLGRVSLSRGQAVALAALVVVLVAGAAGVALSLSATDSQPDATAKGVAVSVYVVRPQDLAVTTTVAGVLSPATSLDLNCRVAGVVQRVNVSLGQPVSKGQVLFSLSNSDIIPQVTAAAAALDAARAGLLRARQGATWEELEQVRSTLTQAQAGWDAAVQTYERMRFLYGEGAVSRQQFEAAEIQVRVATAQLTAAQMQAAKVEGGADAATLLAAEAQVKQAQAAYEAASAALENTILRAPIAGVVSYIAVSEGELTGPGAPQVGIVATGRVYLEAAVTESLLPSLVKGQEIDVYVPAYKLWHTATVDEIAPAANPQTRLFQVRIGLDNADGTLRGGLTAEARIETSRSSGVLAVPRAAIVTTGKTDSVFIVVDGIARRREVTLGLLTGDLAEVVDGVAAGERVVVAGADFMRDGTAVNVVREVTN